MSTDTKMKNAIEDMPENGSVKVTYWRPRERETVYMTPEDAGQYITDARENVPGILDAYMNNGNGMLYCLYSVDIPDGVIFNNDKEELAFVRANLPKALNLT